MRRSFKEAQAKFGEHNGILRTSQAKDLGIDPKTIAEMREAGLVNRLSRGLYRLAEYPPLAYPDLIIVASRVPKAVICLISALAFHNLTTQVPRKVYIALPQSIRRPRIERPQLDIVWLSEVSYEHGIEEHTLDGVPVPIYSKAKTIADCFKFRGKVGKDIAVEALKDYVQLPGVEIDEILRYARINRVENVMRPYLETVVS
ncbi:MAG TPA: type IV toxin-antitoxin system AbiEi family antitoxin domain-containing protein [candidate division Zixibacteria bacterium]|nr:type IV toxin-antitoxin system AbiEi family antitoxin domain-containing protein [candidate division Zixibacteria bacterium]